MTEFFLIFGLSLVLVIKGATLATRYSVKLAEDFGISRYVTGFAIVSVISTLPEAIISVSSTFQGVPEFGLGTLFGSNIANLSLVFALLVLLSGRSIKIENKILKNINLFPFFLLFPIILGLNGHFSRIDGAILIIAGLIFYYFTFKNGTEAPKEIQRGYGKYKNVLFLLFALALLLGGSHFTVKAATALAEVLNITPILVGLLIVSLGTIIPEFLYSFKAIEQKEDSLAIGDIFGSVLADATIVVGIIALISPFYFPARIVYVSGIFMVVASLFLLGFMRSGRKITRKEGFMLLIFWLIYVAVEFLIS